MKEAQLEVLRSEANKNNAEAAAANSQSMRNWIDSYASKPLGLGFDGMGLRADPFWALSADAIGHSSRSNTAGTGAVIQGNRGAIKPVPDQQISQSGGVTAGTHGAYQTTSGLVLVVCCFLVAIRAPVPLRFSRAANVAVA